MNQSENTEMIVIAPQRNDVAVHQSTDELRAVVKASPLLAAGWNCSMEGVVVAVVTNDVGRILLINEQASRVYGYTAAEAINFTLPKLFPKMVIDAFLATDADSLELPDVVQGLRRDGSELPMHVKLTRVTVSGEEVWVIYFRDMTRYDQQRKEIERLAHMDQLTGLPNRNLFIEHLKKTLAQARRYNRLFAILYIDLDKFKIINDTKGHHVGDRVLREIGKRFKSCVRDTDTVGRVGGDEFVALLCDLQREEDVKIVADRFLKVASEPIVVQGGQYELGASIGVAIFPKDGDNMEEMMKNADAAMYHAKKKGGGNQYVFYNEELNDIALKKAKVEQGLRTALLKGQFVLHYQPQIDLISGDLVGAEALIRWDDGTRLVPPLDFIPIAEETGLIAKMGEWALREACREAVKWNQMGLGGIDGIRIGVNLSVKQFNDSLTDTVLEILEDTGLAPAMLDLEITESFLASDRRTTSILEQLKGAGVRLSVDDFGTGFSCLQYLKDLPLHTIKIDRSFVRDLGDEKSERNRAIVETIITLAQRLNHTLVAEGVETEEQAEALRSMGCQTCQGFMYSRPLTAEKFIEFARERQR